jgi:uncharacterized protein YxeA
MIENYNDALSIMVLVLIIVIVGRYFIKEFAKGRMNYLKRVEDEYYDYDDIYDEEE